MEQYLYLHSLPVCILHIFGHRPEVQVRSLLPEAQSVDFAVTARLLVTHTLVKKVSRIIALAVTDTIPKFSESSDEKTPSAW